VVAYTNAFARTQGHHITENLIDDVYLAKPRQQNRNAPSCKIKRDTGGMILAFVKLPKSINDPFSFAYYKYVTITTGKKLFGPWWESKCVIGQFDPVEAQLRLTAPPESPLNRHWCGPANLHRRKLQASNTTTAALCATWRCNSQAAILQTLAHEYARCSRKRDIAPVYPGLRHAEPQHVSDATPQIPCDQTSSSRLTQNSHRRHDRPRRLHNSELGKQADTMSSSRINAIPFACV